jgi:hypothetical protein
MYSKTFRGMILEDLRKFDAQLGAFILAVNKLTKSSDIITAHVARTIAPLLNQGRNEVARVIRCHMDRDEAIMFLVKSMQILNTAQRRAVGLHGHCEAEIKAFIKVLCDLLPAGTNIQYILFAPGEIKESFDAPPLILETVKKMVAGSTIAMYPRRKKRLKKRAVSEGQLSLF